MGMCSVCNVYVETMAEYLHPINATVVCLDCFTWVRSGMMQRRCGDCMSFSPGPGTGWCGHKSKRMGISSLSCDDFRDIDPEAVSICLKCRYFGKMNRTHSVCTLQDAIWTCYLPIRRDCEVMKALEKSREPIHDFDFMTPKRQGRTIVRLK